MAILQRYEKQPAEVQDYDIDFSAYLTFHADTAVSHVVIVDPGITLMSSTLNAGVVKVWLSGGASKTSYKVTARLTTTGGRVKEAEIVVRVKEV